MTFGERLRRLREGRYSQEELANMLGVHSVTISKWETMGREPNAKNVEGLAQILGTTTAYLLGDTDDPSAGYRGTELSTPAPVRHKNTYPNLAYWGGVADNARQAAKDGQDLSIIYALLANAASTIKSAMA